MAESPFEIIKPGMTLGKLTVVSEADPGRRGMLRWNCKCECGTELVLNDRTLKERGVMSCGCESHAKDFTGRRFGMYTVLGHGKYASNGHLQWICQCDCGKIKEVQVETLTTKRKFPYPNCGCTSISDLTKITSIEAGT